MLFSYGFVFIVVDGEKERVIREQRAERSYGLTVAPDCQTADPQELCRQNGHGEIDVISTTKGKYEKNNNGGKLSSQHIAVSSPRT